MPQDLQTLSVIDALTNALRDRILTEDIPSNSVLPEVMVATEYNVARPSARAALERLAQEGLLRRETNKAARVPRLGPDDVRDLYTSRIFLERGVVSELARRQLVPADARAAHLAFQHSVLERSLPGIVTADIGFHLAMVEALESPRISRMFRTVIGEAHLCMAQVQTHHLLSADLIAAEHSSIIEAIESGDDSAAALRLDEHLTHARGRLLQYLHAPPGDEVDSSMAAKTDT
jgi:DNA-binding GntR family transcriptional regulator